MRLEGRSPSIDREHSSEKHQSQAYHAKRRQGGKCTLDYICPPDWCHATRDVASASELPAADQLPRRSVTMSSPICFQPRLIKAIASSAGCGVR